MSCVAIYLSIYLSIYQAVTGLSINILCFVKKQFRKLPEQNILFSKMRSFTEKQTGNLAFQTEFVLTATIQRMTAHKA